MFIPLGQIGMGQLTEDEKREFIDFLNAKLAEEGAGSVKPIMEDEIHKNSAFDVLSNTLNVIAAVQIIGGAASKNKKVRDIYDQAVVWMKSKGKDTAHMGDVEKTISFMEENSDAKPVESGDTKHNE